MNRLVAHVNDRVGWVFVGSLSLDTLSQSKPTQLAEKVELSVQLLRTGSHLSLVGGVRIRCAVKAANGL